MAPRKVRLNVPAVTDSPIIEEPRRNLRSRKAQTGDDITTALASRKDTSANAGRKRKTTLEDPSNTQTDDQTPRKKIGKRAKLVSRDVTAVCNNRPVSKLLEFPAELLQNICLSPSLKTRDAIAFSQTCRTFSNRLDNFFWYQRLNVGPHYINAYDLQKDYQDEALRACCGWTGGYLGDGINHIAKLKRATATPEVPVNMTARQERWMALSVLETYYCCQICCHIPAERYYPNFRLLLCFYCIREYAIATSKLKKLLPKLQIPDNVRKEPFVKGISAEYVWLADINTKSIPIYGATVRELLDDRRKTSEQNALALQTYRDRQRRLTFEHCKQFWAEPQYDQFREIITGDMMEKYLKTSVDRINFLDGIRKPPPFDKTESWFRDRFDEYLGVLRDGSYQIGDSNFSITANQFHLRRLMRSLDAGGFTAFDPAFSGGSRIPSYYSGPEFTSSSDGKVLVGACKVCYDNIKNRFLQHKATTQTKEDQGLEVEREETIGYLEDFRDRCHNRDRWPAPWGYVFYKNHSALGLVIHYERFHRGMVFSKEANPNGEWFTFMSDVAGLEPRRVLSLMEDSVERRIPLPGGPYVLKFFKEPQVQEVV